MLIRRCALRAAGEPSAGHQRLHGIGRAAKGVAQGCRAIPSSVLSEASYGLAPAFTALAIDILLQNGRQVADLIMSGVLNRYPTIKFVSVESGIGWIPFMLEAMDYQFQGNSVREERPEFDLLPSDYFARNVYACYWFEQVAPRRLLTGLARTT